MLATTRTSTMEREMNEAAEQGYRFETVMGGDRESGDTELVAIMERDPSPARRHYRVVATSATSTLQEELEEAGAEGYDHRGQTIYSSFFGGAGDRRRLERDEDSAARYEYELLATKPDIDHARGVEPRRSAGIRGRRTDRGETEFGGSELVVVTRRIDAQ